MLKKRIMPLPSGAEHAAKIAGSRRPDRGKIAALKRRAREALASDNKHMRDSFFHEVLASLDPDFGSIATEDIAGALELLPAAFKAVQDFVINVNDVAKITVSNEADGDLSPAEPNEEPTNDDN